MNATRRNAIKKLAVQLETMVNDLELVLDEEQYAYDNMPESLQEAANGVKSLSAVGAIEVALEAMAEALENLLEVVE